MIKNGILICMATKEEFNENKPVYKANMFKYGSQIKKYIESELKLSLFERIDAKAENTRVDNIEDKVEKLQKDVQALTELVLMAIPPDTPERRKIVEENFSNKENCMKLLNTQFK